MFEFLVVGLLVIIAALLGGAPILSGILTVAGFIILIIWFIVSDSGPLFVKIFAYSFVGVMVIAGAGLSVFFWKERARRQIERKRGIIRDLSKSTKTKEEQKIALSKSKHIENEIFRHPSGVFILVRPKNKLEFCLSIEEARKMQQVLLEIQKENEALGL